MKRLFLLFFSALLCTAVSAHDFVVDGIYYDITSSSDLTVGVTYRGAFYDDYSNEYSGSVVIPEKVTYDSKEYSVTSIGHYAFYNCSGLTSVTIPNSVTSIGHSAFYGTGWYNNHSDGIMYLDSWLIGYKGYRPTGTLEIKEGTRGIANYAFEGCSGLTSVTIPNSVTSIGQSAFYKCSGLTAVHITDLSAWCKIKFVNSDSNPTYYAHHLYLNGKEIRNLVIPNSVTSIGSSAFYYCSGLTSVTIPNSVTSIGNNAFAHCRGLTAVHITDLSAWCKIEFGNSNSNPTEYAHHLYLNGEEITNLVIPDDVTSIGDAAFIGCSGLTSVTIPNSVTSIEMFAFRDCFRLTSVTIPNSVTSIGNYAFNGCSGLTSVTIPNSVTSIGEYAFEYCSGLTSVTIGNSVTSIGYAAFSGCSGLTSVTIPNSVTSIGNSAFRGCSGLTSVTIGNSVTSIGNDAFYGTGWYNNHSDGILYLDSWLIGYKGDKPTGTLEIKEGTRGIANKAFYGCSGLTSINIPNSVTSIGDDAFYGCSGLTSIYIPESVTRISQKAFFGSIRITRIDCMAATPPAAYANTFSSVIYTKATLNVPEGSVEKYKVANIWKEFTNMTAGDVSTNINQTEMRGVMATCSGGIITVSGLTDGETVMFYDANGALLYTGTAQNGTISYTPSTSGVIIVKIGTASIKVVS